MKLDTFARYGTDGSSARVRIYDWLPRLSPSTDVRTHTYIGAADNSPETLLNQPSAVVRAEWSLRASARSELDRVIISRSVSPFSNGRLEEKLAQRAEHSAYDIDDAIMLPREGFKDRVFSEKRIFQRACRAASVVIAGNEYLANRASEHAHKVVIVPSCVEMSDYAHGVSPTDESPMRVVWIGSPSTERYLHRLAGVFNALHREFGVTLTVISAGSSPLPSFNEGVFKRVSWAADSFAEALGNCEVGIMPLEDSEWEQGKCAYKLLQYGASGLPVVGSPVGASAKALEVLGGYAADTNQDWYEALSGLERMGRDQRSSIGEAALEQTRLHYSYDAWFETWQREVMSAG